MSDQNQNDDGDGGDDSGDARTPLQERLHRLQGLVMQNALPHVRDAVKKNLAGLQLDEERIDTIVDELRADLLSRGETSDDVEAAVASAREDLVKAGQGDPELVEQIVGMALLDASPKVVVAWINALNTHATRGGGLAWIRGSALGDDMLPTSDKGANAYFDQEFNDESAIDGDTARAILRDIRAGLPAGTVLPKDMIEALDLAWSIMLVP